MTTDAITTTQNANHDALEEGPFINRDTDGVRTAECNHCGKLGNRAFNPGADNGLPTLARMSHLTDSGVDASQCYRCDDCNAVDIRAAFMRGESDYLYVSSDDRYLTTWTGVRVARVTHTRSGGRGWHGSEVVHYSARLVDANGNALDCWVWGRNGGAGMAIRVRPYTCGGKVRTTL